MGAFPGPRVSGRTGQNTAESRVSVLSSRVLIDDQPAARNLLKERVRPADPEGQGYNAGQDQEHDDSAADPGGVPRGPLSAAGSGRLRGSLPGGRGQADPREP